MLTLKQEKFVEELIKGKSQRVAYRAAYNAKGLSDNGADVAACKLLKTPKVKLRYEELRAKADEHSGNEAASMRAFIIAQLQDIASGAAKDEVKDYDSEGVLIKSRTQLRQADRANALDKLSVLYGVNQQVDNSVQIQIGAEASEYGD
jgi:phage terminase small subunit